MKKLITVIFLILAAGSSGLRAGNWDRGVASVGKDAPVFLPKGSVVAGGVLNLSSSTLDNYNFAIVEGINSKGLSFSVRPKVYVAFADNFAAGLSLSYRRSSLDLSSASLKFGDATIEVTDYNNIGHTFGARAFGRAFLPLGGDRVALFADLGLGYEGGQAKVTSRQGDAIIGSYQTSRNFIVDFCPGVSARLTPRFILEADLGVAQFNVGSVSQIHNQVDTGSRRSTGAYFMLNLLSVSVGAYYRF